MNKIPYSFTANATNLVGIQQENGNVTYDSIFNSTGTYIRNSYIGKHGPLLIP